jgi:hypothetical protein
LLAAADSAANDKQEAASIVTDSLETPSKLDIIFNEALQVIFGGEKITARKHQITRRG